MIGCNIYYITTDTFGVIIGNNGVNDLKMEHDISLLPSSTLQFCYYVEAISQINMPDSSIMEVASRSPIVCVTKLVDYYIPNVFNPNGVNTEFRPYTSNEELISSYDLIIFDRWGNLIFESKNFTEGWKGTRKIKKSLLVFTPILSKKDLIFWQNIELCWNCSIGSIIISDRSYHS